MEDEMSEAGLVGSCDAESASGQRGRARSRIDSLSDELGTSVIAFASYCDSLGLAFRWCNIPG